MLSTKNSIPVGGFLYSWLSLQKIFILEELQQLLTQSSEQISVPLNLLNFVLCLIVSLTIRYYYLNFSNSLSGKFHIGQVLPMLSAIVFLVIVVVKSSLALSLGLVGALSIVRFRTPIKEPEELVYLFLSIAVGLGFGAGYSLITSLGILIILTFNYFFLTNERTIKANEYNLVIDVDNEELNFDSLIKTISDYCDSIKFIRVSSEKKKHNLVLLISMKTNSSINSVIEELSSESTSVSIHESNTNW